MIEDSENGVYVTVYETKDNLDNWAEVDVAHWPDGSVKNNLDAEELKQVADMLYAMAEKMETNSPNP